MITDSNEINLSGMTTLRLGGPADRLVIATTEDEVIEAVTSVQGPFVILAGGSNVVIGDAGFRGTVVAPHHRGVVDVTHTYDQVDTGRVVWMVAAGEPWDNVCAKAAHDGYSGIECLSGIPGSAGATPVQNVGAYGQEVAETIVSVRAYDRYRREIRVFSPDECGFGYRTSFFKNKDRYVILATSFELRRSSMSAPIRYAELARALGVNTGDSAPLVDTREAVLALRASKGMVVDPSDPDTWSVGSFFTNPFLDTAAMNALLSRADSSDLPPCWPCADGLHKTSAAWLIERSGFHRGYQGPRGVVAVSSKHTLALTHRGGGTTEDLMSLARQIRHGVEARFGVRMVPEAVFVGCEL